jgi:hypothetical protein
MKPQTLSGAVLAVAALSLALGGAVPAQARHKAHRPHKPVAEKHNCGGKNGCPGVNKSESAPKPEEKPAPAPATEKPAEAKPSEPK